MNDRIPWWGGLLIISGAITFFIFAALGYYNPTDIFLKLSYITIPIVLFALFILPSAIAFNKKHDLRWIVLFLNIFAGWTFLVWLILLIWMSSYKLERNDKRTNV
jgi:hypothetical protein